MEISKRQERVFMRNKNITRNVILTIGIILVSCFVFDRIYFYADFFSRAARYPESSFSVSYKIDPATILDALEQGKTSVFAPTSDIPAYYYEPGYNTPALPIPSWTQVEFLKVANALHEHVWKESLENYQLYSLDFRVSECDGTFKADHASFQFYQQQGNWHYIVHNMVIDLQYGYVDAGDSNGDYTGRWEDIDLHSALINDAGKALLIAEENGGREARLPVQNDPNCSISIELAPNIHENSTTKWNVRYSLYRQRAIYSVLIDPFTGSYELFVLK